MWKTIDRLGLALTRRASKQFLNTRARHSTGLPDSLSVEVNVAQGACDPLQDDPRSLRYRGAGKMTASRGDGGDVVADNCTSNPLDFTADGVKVYAASSERDVNEASALLAVR